MYLDPAGFDQIHVMPVESLPGPSLWQTTPYPLGGAGAVLVSVLANPGEELRITSEKDRPDDDANDPKTPFCNMTLLRLDIDLEGITDSDEESLGGVVVRHHDGNGAPRKQLLIHKVAPNAAWNGNVTLHCSDTSKVTLFDAANGGAEVLFNGIDNTFANSTIPEEGKSLYVQGDTGSLSMRDVEFKLTTSDTGSFSDRVCLSVVWVNISPDHTAEVDTDNALRSQFVTRRMAPTPFLGDANIIPDWETVLKARTSEFIGAVWPSDFDINSHPVSFDFRQDVLSARFYLEYGSSRYIVRAEDNISDNPEGWVDLDPAPYGNIYFLDSPGMEQTLRLENGAPAPHGTVMRMRGNFECWATISDGSNGIETRCSTKLQWYTRSSHELTGETEVDSATIFTSDTIGVLSASWTSDKWFPGAVTVHEGTGAKQSRRVTGNTTGTINITPSWDTLLNFDSIFQVINWSTWTKINDITNDNKSGNGSTSITWDLN